VASKLIGLADGILMEENASTNDSQQTLKVAKNEQ
jgi:hypothetical protein